MALNLDQFIAKPHRTRACIVCANKKAAADVKKFLQRKAKGEHAHALHYLHEHYLVPEHALTCSKGTLYKHVAECLRLDIRTGAPLK